MTRISGKIREDLIGGTTLSYNVAFISLGCAKNQVNCEQMMALTQKAGNTLQVEPEGADVVVVNTCGFLQSAAEEAIDNILQMAELKKAGKIKKILVTGCMAQRYQTQVTDELPEVDGILGTGSYGDIAQAIEQVMGGEHPADFKDIHTCEQAGERILTTPSWYAYLRIAEGCDNHCAYCVIPSIRGRYRSRPMDGLLEEARELADAGVKECIVIAQDITRYGTDFDGKHHLAELLRELCKLDFHWIRLHYLYPDEITEELIDTIASEPKICKYIDLPIQHCNDTILKKMNRRDTKVDLTALFAKLRDRIPGLVLRTSLITGLPYEDDAAFEELCEFLRDVKIERAGVFPFSPEEGAAASKMEHVSMEEALRRKELVEDVQSDIIDAYNESCLGDVREVLCEGFDPQAQMYQGRSYAESPGIDGNILFIAEEAVQPGDFVNVRLTGVMDGELTGERAE
jgi:ribosomal protein S12 methylthiotransferase